MGICNFNGLFHTLWQQHLLLKFNLQTQTFTFLYFWFIAVKLDKALQHFDNFDAYYLYFREKTYNKL